MTTLPKNKKVTKREAIVLVMVGVMFIFNMFFVVYVHNLEVRANELAFELQQCRESTQEWQPAPIVPDLEDWNVGGVGR